MAAASAGTLSLHALLVARLALFWGRMQANMTCVSSAPAANAASNAANAGAADGGGGNTTKKEKAAAAAMTEEDERGRERQQLQDFKKWLRKMAANQRAKLEALQAAFTSMAANPAATEEQIKVRIMYFIGLSSEQIISLWLDRLQRSLGERAKLLIKTINSFFFNSLSTCVMQCPLLCSSTGTA